MPLDSVAADAMDVGGVLVEGWPVGEEGLCPPRRAGGNSPRHAVGSTGTDMAGATPALRCVLARSAVCTLPRFFHCEVKTDATTHVLLC